MFGVYFWWTLFCAPHWLFLLYVEHYMQETTFNLTHQESKFIASPSTAKHHVFLNQIIPCTQASLSMRFLKPLWWEDWGHQPCWKNLFDHLYLHSFQHYPNLVTRRAHRINQQIKKVCSVVCAWLTLSLNAPFALSNGKSSRYLHRSTSCYTFWRRRQSFHLNPLRPNRPAGVPA